MTNEELEKLSNKIYSKVKNIPYVDKDFIKKCLVAVSTTADQEMHEKIKQLAKIFQ